MALHALMLVDTRCGRPDGPYRDQAAAMLAELDVIAVPEISIG